MFPPGGVAVVVVVVVVVMVVVVVHLQLPKASDAGMGTSLLPHATAPVTSCSCMLCASESASRTTSSACSLLSNLHERRARPPSRVRPASVQGGSVKQCECCSTGSSMPELQLQAS